MNSSMFFPTQYQHLEVSEYDKHMYGEVATPYQVIEDMFELLPSEIFENPDLKWFDPCCGNGFFMEILYNRLFCGLQEYFSDEADLHPYKCSQSENHLISNRQCLPGCNQSVHASV